MGNSLKLSVGRIMAPYLDSSSGTQLEGEVFLNEDFLQHEVKVVRDDDGIPHIYAKTLLDLFTAQGFIHAQDRLWQIESMRRVGKGTLSELVGENGLEIDKVSRTLGFRRLAINDLKNIEADVKEEKETANGIPSTKTIISYLKAYTIGVNAFIERKKEWPVEFSFAKLEEVENYSLVDILTIGRVFSFQMCFGSSDELLKGQLITLLGPEAASELNFFDDTSPPQVRNPIEGVDPKSVPLENTDVDSLGLEDNYFQDLDIKGLDFKNVKNVSADDGIPRGEGSNAWAVSGKFTKSGKPIVCSDPHLTLNNPSTFYLNHLVCEEQKFSIQGISIPGYPAVLMGSNDRICWGITLSLADVEDIYIEKVQEENGKPKKYLHKETEWKEIEEIKEIISIKDREDVIFPVFSTSRGPLISDKLGIMSNKNAIFQKDNEDEKDIFLQLSLQAIWLKSSTLFSHTFSDMLKLSFSKDVHEFRNILKNINAVTLNFILADGSGNICYQLTGFIPLRGKMNCGAIPYPAWDERYKWLVDEKTGHNICIPKEHLPYELNPDEGFVFSANHKIIDYKNYPYWLGNKFFSGNRARVISRELTKLIESEKKIEISDMSSLQVNTENLLAVDFCKLIEESFKGIECKDEKINLALKILSEWSKEGSEMNNGKSKGLPNRMESDSIGAGIFHVCFNRLFHLVFSEVIATSMSKVIDAKEDLDNNYVYTTNEMMLGSGWNEKLKPVSEMEPICDVLLLKLLKKDQKSWWIRNSKGRSTIELFKIALKQTIDHFVTEFGEDQKEWRYGRVFMIEFVHPFSAKFGPSPFNIGPFEASGSSQSVFMYRTARGESKKKPASALFRQVYDFGDPFNSLHIMPLGNGARLSSKFRSNLTEKWIKGQYIKSILKDEELLEKSEHVLLLKPGGKEEEEDSICNLM